MSTGRSFGGRAAGTPGTERPRGLKDAAPDLGAAIVTPRHQSHPSTAQPHWGSSRRRRGCCRGRKCLYSCGFPLGNLLKIKLPNWRLGEISRCGIKATGGDWMVQNPHISHSSDASFDPKHTLCPISSLLRGAAVRAMALLQPSVRFRVNKAATWTRAKPTLPLLKKQPAVGSGCVSNLAVQPHALLWCQGTTQRTAQPLLLCQHRTMNLFCRAAAVRGTLVLELRVQQSQCKGCCLPASLAPSPCAAPFPQGTADKLPFSIQPHC